MNAVTAIPISRHPFKFVDVYTSPRKPIMPKPIDLYRRTAAQADGVEPSGLPQEGRRIRTAIAVLLCVSFASCASDQYSFIDYSQQVDPHTGQYNSARALKLSDALALNYASSVAALLRAKYTGARITREISTTAQLGLAAAAAYGAAFNYSKSTLAVLGLASAGVPELQRIFGAKERAQTYQDAIRLIEEAQIEYLALNQQPSADVLTQNGVTLLQRVTASIHVVEKTLAGNLPTVEDMQKATEQMSRNGAKPTSPGDPVFNNRPANTEPRPPELLRTRFEGPISTTTVTIDKAPVRDEGTVVGANNLRGRIRKLTDAAADAILAAGRAHADLQPQFDRSPQDNLSPRQYLFYLIEHSNQAELNIWRALIPVRPATTATPTPGPAEPTPPAP